MQKRDFAVGCILRLTYIQPIAYYAAGCICGHVCGRFVGRRNYMRPRSAKQSARRLVCSIKAGNTFVAPDDYAVCGVRKGDLLVYDKSARPATACGLVVVVRTSGEVRAAANFLAYEPAPPDVSSANNDRTIRAGEICISVWDGKRIRFMDGTAHPVTHVVVRAGGGRAQVVALDLGLESSDDTIVCKILLDAARTFSAIGLDVAVSGAGIGTRV
jgi:hypothetical protein